MENNSTNFSNIEINTSFKLTHIYEHSVKVGMLMANTHSTTDYCIRGATIIWVTTIATNRFVVSATALSLRNIYLKANLAKTLVSLLPKLLFSIQAPLLPPYLLLCALMLTGMIALLSFPFYIPVTFDMLTLTLSNIYQPRRGFHRTNDDWWNMLNRNISHNIMTGYVFRVTI